MAELCFVIIGSLFLLYSLDIMILLFSLGVLCNALVQVFNRGLMPVLPSAVIKAHGLLYKRDIEGRIKGMTDDYCYTHSKTRLAFLGDNFYFNGFWGEGIVSVGDLLILMAPIYGVIYQMIKLFS